MEFRTVQINGAKVFEVIDLMGDRMAVLDPDTMELFPIGTWGRVDGLRLARKVRRFCPPNMPEVLTAESVYE
jgi:hypothetical protein